MTKQELQKKLDRTEKVLRMAAGLVVGAKDMIEDWIGYQTANNRNPGDGKGWQYSYHKFGMAIYNLEKINRRT